MVILALSLRDMQNMVPSLNLPWGSEPYPDHSYIDKAFKKKKKIDQDYLDLILENTAYLCIKENFMEEGRSRSGQLGRRD
jgi:hypothetical protein